MKFSFIFFLISALIASGGFAEDEPPIDLRVDNFFDALVMSFEQDFRAKEQLRDWYAEEMRFNNENRIDEKGNCYHKSPGEVLMVLRIELSGEISGVYTSKDNAKAKCFIENHMGVVLPEPPFGPVYILKRML